MCWFGCASVGEMAMLRILMTGAAAVAVLLPAQAFAQASGAMTMHNKGHFKGAQKVIAGPRQFIEPPFVVKSVTVPPGTQWELCSGNTYSGCKQVSQSVPSMVMTVRSVRPVAAILTATTTASGQLLTGTGSPFGALPASISSTRQPAAIGLRSLPERPKR